MTPVRVFIATTAGLVAVQRITEEDPEVNSVVCLAGKAVALPISAAYEAFVRDPTGVIQRHFGHPAYRVDVSSAVDEGYSWQLALFAAHALVKAGRLAHPDAEVQLTVIATGEVNRDLHVLEVDHMTEKFGDLAAQLDAIGADPARTVMAVPRGNGDAVKEHAAAADVAGGLTVLPIAHARELLDHLGLPMNEGPAAAVPKEAAAAPENPRSRRVMMLAILALLLTAGAGATGVRYSPQLKQWAAQWVPALKDAKPPLETAKLPPPSTSVPKITPAPAPNAAPPPLPPPIQVTKPAVVPPPIKAAEPAPEKVAAPTPEPAPKPARKLAAKPKTAPKPIPKPVPTKVSAPPKDDLKPVDAPPKTDVIETVRLGEAPKGAVSLEILENRAPNGYTCRDVRSGRIEAETQQAPEKGPFAFGPSVMENLCSVEIKATADEDGMYLFGRYHRWTQNRPGKGPPDKVIDLGPRQGSVHWSVDIPERMGRGASFQVLVFSSWNSFNVPTKLLARIGTKPRSPEARRAVKRLKRRGIALKTTRFRVIPERRTPPPPRNQSWLPNTGG